MTPLSQPVLARTDWLEAAAAHRAKARAWTQPVRERKAQGDKHPLHDFLHTYYQFSLGKLERWHPGFGVVLEDCEEARRAFPERHYRFTEETCRVDPVLLEEKIRKRLRFIRHLLQTTRSRPPNFACHGLHEWAMVYRGTMVRHGETIPLRLPQEEIDALVNSRPLCCSHFDAFRFFAPEARPLNHLQLDLRAREDNEQPGCVHANMDLYKWAAKSLPWISSDLLWECFHLALKARELDMRASPYDLSSFGHEPIAVETGTGRSEYEQEQRLLTEEARPLRDGLIRQLDNVLAADGLR